MTKYRTKPVIVEAMQLSWDTWSEICDFAGVGKLIDGKPEGSFLSTDGKILSKGLSSDRFGLCIPSPGGGLCIGQEDDWIVKEPGGKLCVYPPNIFEQTYEKIGGLNWKPFRKLLKHKLTS